MKYKFFGGTNCSPCNTLKARITELGLHDSFDWFDVTVDVNEACEYHVRSIPHIVSSDGSHYIGLADGVKLVDMIKDLS